MKSARPFARARGKQGGYALLLVVFLTALVLVGTMSIGLRIATEGRRQKEMEMIWRGKQYTRGIKMYYRKFGRFPTSLDNLTKPGLGNVRFMRQEYTDPMNKEDGTWRMIYVGPAGQLIGSLKPQPGNLQLPSSVQVGGSLGAGALSATGPLGGNTTTNATPGAPPGPGTGTLGPGATTTATGAQGTNSTATGTDQPVPTGDTPTVVGGNIIGVGSKINEHSVIVYETATNYRLFEFIWDPSKNLGGVGAVGAPNGTLGAMPGQTPGPGGTQQNPPQNPQQNPPQGTNPQ
jgi:hypothetical protein